MSVETVKVLTASSDAFWNGPGLLQAGAIVVSAIGVAMMIRTNRGIAENAQSLNRAIARKRAVLDLIVKEQTDGDMIQARKRFVKLKDVGQVEQYATPDKITSDEAADIRFILNMYEAVAIGIKQDAYDEAIYKDWCRTTAVKDWMACKGFVARHQQDFSSQIWLGFEEMAKRWAKPDELRHC